MSTNSSRSSLHNEKPEVQRHRHARKPVPPLLEEIPVPTRRTSLLSNAAAFKRFVELCSEPAPPLPDNWAENIAKYDGPRKRRSSPDSDTSEESDVEHGVTATRVKTAAQETEKALPQVPRLREARRLSDDARSTRVVPAVSMKLEAAESSTPSRSLRPRRAPSMPTISEHIATPPAALHNKRRARTDGAGVAVDPSVSATRYRLVYAHEGGNRHARVWPDSWDSASDLSLPPTSVDRHGDVGTPGGFSEWEDVKVERLHDSTSSKCGSLGGSYCRHSGGFRTGLRHTLRGLFCLKSGPSTRC